jgi:hypothetical protein
MPGFDPKTCSHVDRSSSSPPSHSVHIEDLKLYMPSDLSDTDHRKYCPNGLAAMEDRLRYAEATDSLESMCHQLRTHSFTNHFKIANITGQIHNTRARETQHSIDDRVQTYELQYRCTRAAILKLRGNGPWEDVLKVLDHSDVQALNKRELTAQEKEDIRRVRERNGVILEADDINAERVLATVASVGEGHCRPSWIWYTGNVYEDMNDPLTRAGAYKSIILFLLLTDASLQPYELNGQRQKHALIGGRRR